MARKKKGSQEDGVPGWIVTFSDLMSLLLTFFVLLLSFSTISEEDFNEAMMSLQGALGILPRYSGVVAPVPRPPSRSSEEMRSAARRLQRRLLVEGKERQVKIEFDAVGGLKISLPGAVLFDAGSAILKPDAYPVLRDVGEVLSELPETFIEVRGHTDNTALADTVRYRDNFDLSYFRADAVARQVNVYGGVPLEQFELVACGAGQPMATNATQEGRRANRRVEIFVRGLVEKRKLESLQQGIESMEAFQPPAAAPSPPVEPAR